MSISLFLYSQSAEVCLKLMKTLLILVLELFMYIYLFYITLMLLYSEAYSCNSTKKNHSKILINRDHIEKDHIKNFVCSENIRRYFSNINLI